MNKYLILILVFLIQEFVSIIVFSFIKKRYEKGKPSEKRYSSFKGTLERAVLLLGLTEDLPVTITFFAALKVATKLTNANDPSSLKISNDYFLIGNLTSVLLVLISYGFYEHFCK